MNFQPVDAGLWPRAHHDAVDRGPQDARLGWITVDHDRVVGIGANERPRGAHESCGEQVAAFERLTSGDGSGQRVAATRHGHIPQGGGTVPEGLGSNKAGSVLPRRPRLPELPTQVTVCGARQRLGGMPCRARLLWPGRAAPWSRGSPCGAETADKSKDGVLGPCRSGYRAAGHDQPRMARCTRGNMGCGFDGS